MSREWAAGADTPGAARTEGASLIVVSFHLGPNYDWEPSDAIRALARAMVAAGADIVHEHSSHHVQGVEIYLGKPILYGSGDFVDDYAVDDEYRNDLGFAYMLELDFETKTPLRLEIHPTKIKGFRVSSRMLPHEREWLLTKMQALTERNGTQTERKGEGEEATLLVPINAQTGEKKRFQLTCDVLLMCYSSVYSLFVNLVGRLRG
eukprot:jgi/Chlat1/173/Chrsp1S00231